MANGNMEMTLRPVSHVRIEPLHGGPTMLVHIDHIESMTEQPGGTMRISIYEGGVRSSFDVTGTLDEWETRLGRKDPK